MAAGAHRPVEGAAEAPGRSSRGLGELGSGRGVACVDVEPAEVRQLAATLVDGSIQVPEVRQHLWRSFGPCPRHAWAYAVVECELRLRPMGCAILYEDLTRRTASLVSNPVAPERWRRRRLHPRGECFTCRYCEIARSRASAAEQERAAFVNQRSRFLELLMGAEEVFRPRACPSCTGASGFLCREHLVAARAGLASTAPYLFDVASRLRRFVRSMTWQGPPARPEDVSALVEALGFFAGWWFPMAVLDQARGGR
jgi:hypothetical protein